MSEIVSKSIDEFMNPPKKERRNWSQFVEGDVVAFFNAKELEKMTIEDGEGNKARLSRLKDNGVKIEYTSSIIV